MTNYFDYSGNLLPPEKRLTKFCVFLKSISLDEMPLLMNALIWEVSFFRPRPVPEEYFPLFNKVQKLKHNFKLGITGLAQLNRKNSIPWEERFPLDLKYVRNRSLISLLKYTSFNFIKGFCKTKNSSK